MRDECRALWKVSYGGGIYIAQHKAKCPLPYSTLEHLKWSLLWEHLCFCPPDLHLLFSDLYNSPEPYGCSSLFLFLGSLALGHLCKAICPLCFWRKTFSSRKMRERWYYILLIWFFVVVVPVTLSFMFKTIRCQPGVAIFVFSLQDYVITREISIVASLKPQLCFIFFFFWLYWHDLEGDEKEKLPPVLQVFVNI